MIDCLYCYRSTVFIISIWLVFLYFAIYYNTDWLAILYFTLKFFWRFLVSESEFQKRRRRQRWPAKKIKIRDFLTKRHSNFLVYPKLTFVTISSKEELINNVRIEWFSSERPQSSCGPGKTSWTSISSKGNEFRMVSTWEQWQNPGKWSIFVIIIDFW